jgi:hypothetical protein
MDKALLTCITSVAPFLRGLEVAIGVICYYTTQPNAPSGCCIVFRSSQQGYHPRDSGKANDVVAEMCKAITRIS